MANSVDPVCSGSRLFASILNLSVMLGNYLQQTTSADDIFRCIFFLGTLRVKSFLASSDLSSADNLCKQFGVGPDLEPNCLTH